MVERTTSTLLSLYALCLNPQAVFLGSHHTLYHHWPQSHSPSLRLGLLWGAFTLDQESGVS